MEKVVQLELKRPHRREQEVHFWRDLLAQVRDLTAAFSRLQQEDVQAYFHLTGARAEGEPEALSAAVHAAVDCPRRIGQGAGQALGLLSRVGQKCRRHLVSDLLVACEVLGAALRGAHHIAGANLPLLPGGATREALAAELSQALQTGDAIFQEARAGLLRMENRP
jgi:formiminotetrahydrofolate cyclodeaminase